MKKTVLLLAAITLLTSCFGDKKSAIGTDFNDTSFENKKFKGNKIEFAKITEPSNYITNANQELNIRDIKATASRP